MLLQALVAFLEEQVQEARDQGILFSVHLKATMMKISDPILFGHAVKVYFKDLFAKHGATFDELGVDVNNGFGDLLGKIKGTANEAEILADIDAIYAAGPPLAMVDSDNGITGLHVPSDVIIDASMPAMIRTCFATTASGASLSPLIQTHARTHARAHTHTHTHTHIQATVTPARTHAHTRTHIRARARARTVAAWP